MLNKALLHAVSAGRPARSYSPARAALARSPCPPGNSSRVCVTFRKMSRLIPAGGSDRAPAPRNSWIRRAPHRPAERPWPKTTISANDDRCRKHLRRGKASCSAWARLKAPISKWRSPPTGQRAKLLIVSDGGGDLLPVKKLPHINSPRWSSPIFCPKATPPRRTIAHVKENNLNDNSGCGGPAVLLEQLRQASARPAAADRPSRRQACHPDQGRTERRQTSRLLPQPRRRFASAAILP